MLRKRTSRGNGGDGDGDGDNGGGGDVETRLGARVGGHFLDVKGSPAKVFQRNGVRFSSHEHQRGKRHYGRGAARDATVRSRCTSRGGSDEKLRRRSADWPNLGVEHAKRPIKSSHAARLVDIYIYIPIYGRAESNEIFISPLRRAYFVSREKSIYRNYGRSYGLKRNIISRLKVIRILMELSIIKNGLSNVY